MIYQTKIEASTQIETKKKFLTNIRKEVYNKRYKFLALLNYTPCARNNDAWQTLMYYNYKKIRKYTYTVHYITLFLFFMIAEKKISLYFKILNYSNYFIYF